MKKFLVFTLAAVMIAAIVITASVAVSAKEPVPSGEEQWLCGEDPGENRQPGFWFNPASKPDDRFITFCFTAEISFSGIHGFYYCSNLDLGYGEAVMLIELSKDDEVVADYELHCNGDQWYDTDFGKVFAPGDYELTFSCIDGTGVVNDSWFVIGASDGESDCSFLTSPGFNIAPGSELPTIMLIGAEPEETEEETEENTEEETSELPIDENKGDTNEDGAIDNKDVVVLFRYVSNSSVAYDAKYDINSDNEVNNKDVSTLFRYVSSK